MGVPGVNGAQPAVTAAPWSPVAPGTPAAASPAVDIVYYSAQPGSAALATFQNIFPSAPGSAAVPSGGTWTTAISPGGNSPAEGPGAGSPAGPVAPGTTAVSPDADVVQRRQLGAPGGPNIVAFTSGGKKPKPTLANPGPAPGSPGGTPLPPGVTFTPAPASPAHGRPYSGTPSGNPTVPGAGDPSRQVQVPLPMNLPANYTPQQLADGLVRGLPDIVNSGDQHIGDRHVNSDATFQALQRNVPSAYVGNFNNAQDAQSSFDGAIEAHQQDIAGWISNPSGPQSITLDTSDPTSVGTQSRYAQQTKANQYNAGYFSSPATGTVTVLSRPQTGTDANGDPTYSTNPQDIQVITHFPVDPNAPGFNLKGGWSPKTWVTPNVVPGSPPPPPGDGSAGGSGGTQPSGGAGTSGIIPLGGGSTRSGQSGGTTGGGVTTSTVTGDPTQPYNIPTVWPDTKGTPGAPQTGDDYQEPSQAQKTSAAEYFFQERDNGETSAQAVNTVLASDTWSSSQGLKNGAAAFLTWLVTRQFVNPTSGKDEFR